jgi:hypothetical protein
LLGVFILCVFMLIVVVPLNWQFVFLTDVPSCGSIVTALKSNL